MINLYTDGSTAFKNPSPYGISWAFIAVGEYDNELWRDAGVVRTSDCKDFKASNNLAEMLAAVKALEWAVVYCKKRFDDEEKFSSVKLFSDSELTLNRLFKKYSTKKVPANAVERAKTALKYFTEYDRVSGTLVAGHPTKADLARGYKIKDGRNVPVSKWNVECDRIANELARTLIPT